MYESILLKMQEEIESLRQRLVIVEKKLNNKQNKTLELSEKDAFFDDAVKLVVQHDKASASLLQRRLSIGYARCARILDQLEQAGVIGPGEGSKPRDVLIKSVEEYKKIS